ncbi:MAG: alpha-N-acetylglucosaminidase [Prevotella sp.]|nr:alpha-N-acetylglucosaminidase [Prevotella sp.]
MLALACLLAVGQLSYANPVGDMLERIDCGASKKFKISLVKNEPSTTAFFELSQSGNKVCVKGDSWVSIATGVNWYLKHYCGIHITWNNPTAKLPATLPRVEKPERHETTLTLRYDFNYCTFSYTMAFWDWERWQQEIDWMALHGVNLPLAVVGEECVWRNMLLRLGYTKQEVNDFIAGPAFLAWWEMNNLEGWGGPLPDAWYQQQEVLQKKILKRMKEWGMEPVLPGYSGMVPSNAREKLGLNVADGGTWNGYTRPAFLQPTDERFHEIATLYYKELTALFGKANYYSMDPFHEGGNTEGVDLDASGKAIMREMKEANPKSTWVIQGWQENPREELIGNLPNGDLLILDLFSECRPKWGVASIFQSDKGYGHHNWLFCLLENFGGNVGLHGRMDQLLSNFAQTKTNPKASHLRGIGFTQEGSENNPVMFELMSELPWIGLTPNPSGRGGLEGAAFKEQWLRDYCFARYGVHDKAIEDAWMILANSIYNCPAGNNQQGPHESIFCGRPSQNNYQVSSWSKMSNYYDPDDTRRAALLFASVAEKYRGNNNYEYDLVDIVRQALADQGRVQYQQAMADYKAFRRESFQRDSQRFLEMILDQDRLLGTRSEFRLGHWTEQARSLGTTPEEKDQYEWNARVQITTWGNRICADDGGLRDYAHKEWQGLLKDFYHMRWAAYFKALSDQMVAKSKPDIDKLGSGRYKGLSTSDLFALALEQDVKIDWYALEEPWTLQHNHYSSKPEGDAYAIARDICEKYLKPTPSPSQKGGE